jgi:hypothetical protein
MKICPVGAKLFYVDERTDMTMLTATLQMHLKAELKTYDTATPQL